MSKYIKGLNSAKNSMRVQGQDILGIVRREVERSGREAERDAIRSAPKDTNTLAKRIFYEPTNLGMGARITANTDYAAYQEFGTGGLVDVPKGFEDLAGQFIGGGSRQINMKPQPYLIPSAKRAFERLKERLKNRFK